jgi:hypothetical protein
MTIFTGKNHKNDPSVLLQSPFFTGKNHKNYRIVLVQSPFVTGKIHLPIFRW